MISIVLQLTAAQQDVAPVPSARFNPRKSPTGASLRDAASRTKLGGGGLFDFGG